MKLAFLIAKPKAYEIYEKGKLTIKSILFNLQILKVIDILQ